MGSTYHKLELKTNGEPALVAVAKNTKDITKVDIIFRNPAE